MLRNLSSAEQRLGHPTGKPVTCAAPAHWREVGRPKALMQRVHQHRQVGLAGVARTCEHGKWTQVNGSASYRPEVGDLDAVVAVTARDNTRAVHGQRRLVPSRTVRVVRSRYRRMRSQKLCSISAGVFAICGATYPYRRHESRNRGPAPRVVAGSPLREKHGHSVTPRTINPMFRPASTTWAKTRSGSVYEAQQLIHGQRQDAEHRVVQHLAVPAHAYLDHAAATFSLT